MELHPPVLERMLRESVAAGDDRVPIAFNIPASYAQAIQRCVAGRAISSALEVGMAYGVSSLAILGATADVRLISIDPFQTLQYGRRGRMAVEEAGFGGRHELEEGFDYEVLPRLLAQGRRLQFAYIDGYHTFDHVLLNFFYINMMLDVGGVVAFNDCAMPAVHRVCRFVETHYGYQEVRVGLARSFTGISKRDTVRRRLERRQHEDRYFEKLGDLTPAWDFYAAF